MFGRQLEVLPPRLEIAFVRRRRRRVGHGGQRRRAALMRVRVAGRHGGRQREEGRWREAGSAARINGRADSARPRIAQADGGRAQRAMASAPREREVVGVSDSDSESLGASECNGAKAREIAKVGEERQRASVMSQKKKPPRSSSIRWPRRSGGRDASPGSGRAGGRAGDRAGDARIK